MKQLNYAKCIREVENWGKMLKEHKFDTDAFDPIIFSSDMASSAPKLQALLNTINKLDADDMAREGHMYKHFIYSDIKSGAGAKLMASVLKSGGFVHAYRQHTSLRGKTFVMDEPIINANQNKVFATLTSTTIYEKSLGVQFRKQILSRFNARPTNVYGQDIRIILLDSGFREGVDLFDVKYVHIVEPIATLSDQTQAVGRATRFCGQKGLTFDTQEGWKLHVYKYKTVVPEPIQDFFDKKRELMKYGASLFDMFLYFSNLDPRKLVFAHELEKAVIRGAVDRELTKNMHRFNMNGGSSDYEQTIQSVAEQYNQYAWNEVRVENGCETPAQQVATTITDFSPTQNFIRSYFTARCPLKGMLLYHSVGTGKTCCAIATASSSFEQDKYTILYVTRHTLKMDVWKNMFDQVCNVVLQEKIRTEGMTIPESQAARKKLISDGWFNPLSYKQFSNMLKGQNALYHQLVKKNGSEDPLRKTLVIIDEAHKLFAKDVPSSEKPDMKAMNRMIQKSFKESGRNSVKLLLMTATPYTDDPMDMMRIFNLFRPEEKHMPVEFNEFAEQYLDDGGAFNENGLVKFLNDISGSVSYLNREKDIRAFAQPVFFNIDVPLSDYIFLDTLHALVRKRNELSVKNGMLKNELKDVNVAVQRLIEKEKTRLKPVKETSAFETCNNNIINLTNEIKVRVNAKHVGRLADCEAPLKACVDGVNARYKAEEETIRNTRTQEVKACQKDAECKERVRAQAKEGLNAMRLNRKYDTSQCKQYTTPELEACKKRVYDDIDAEITQEKQKLGNCNSQEKALQDKIAEVNQLIDQKVATLRQQRQQNIDTIQKQVDDLQKEHNELNAKYEKELSQDKSQRSAMEKCLALKPAHKRIYADTDLPNVLRDVSTRKSLDSDTLTDADDKRNRIYMINGHGNENIVQFDKRSTMPANTVLIVFPTCGKYAWMVDGCKFAAFFNDPANKRFLQDPVRYYDKITKHIGIPMHIYLPGDRAPDLSTNLFLNFEKKNTIILKSGVYRMGKIPQIDRNKFPRLRSENLGSTMCQDLIGSIPDKFAYNTSVHNEVYKGNVYKPAAVKNSYTALEQRRFKVLDVLKNMGPGVYYYTGCRYSSQDVPYSMYKGILSLSSKQQKQPDRLQLIEQAIKEIEEAAVTAKNSTVTTNASTEQAVYDVMDHQTLQRLKNIKQEVKRCLKNVELVNIDRIHEITETIQELSLRNFSPEDLQTIVAVGDDIQRIVDIVRGKSQEVAFTLKLRKKTAMFEQNKYIHYYLDKVYDNKTKSEYKHIGCVPASLNVPEIKCSAPIIDAKLRAMLKENKDIMVDLPKTPVEWKTVDVLYVAEPICGAY